MTITGSNTTNFGFQKLGSNDSAGYSTINEVVDGIDTILNASDRLIKASQTPTVAYVITGDGTDWVRGLVVTASITDLNVTTGKIADLAVTTGKIAGDAVTLGTKTSGDYVATITGTANQIASSAATSGEGTTHTLSLVSGATLPGAPTVATAVGSYPQSGTTSRVSTVQYVNDAVANVNASGSVALSGDVGGTAGATVIGPSKVTSNMIVNDTIVDADINTAAAIAYSKLNLASSVTSADIVNNTIVLGDLATALQAFLVPTGTVSAFAGSSAPPGYLLCDGTAGYSTTTYAALFGVIGYTYGGSGGSFTVPDLNGRAAIGKGANAAVNALNLSDTLADAARNPNHAHTITHTHDMGNHYHSNGTLFSAETRGGGISYYQTGGSAGWTSNTRLATGGPVGDTNNFTGGVKVLGDSSTPSTNTTGASSAANSGTAVQPFLVLNYIIKV